MKNQPIFDIDPSDYLKLLESAGQMIQESRALLDQATTDAKKYALKAIEIGISEREVSRRLSVSVSTLRAWQGKK